MGAPETPLAEQFLETLVQIKSNASILFGKDSSFWENKGEIHIEGFAGNLFERYSSTTTVRGHVRTRFLQVYIDVSRGNLCFLPKRRELDSERLVDEECMLRVHGAPDMPGGVQITRNNVTLSNSLGCPKVMFTVLYDAQGKLHAITLRRSTIPSSFNAKYVQGSITLNGAKQGKVACNTIRMRGRPVHLSIAPTSLSQTSMEARVEVSFGRLRNDSPPLKVPLVEVPYVIGPQEIISMVQKEIQKLVSHYAQNAAAAVSSNL